MIRPRSSDFSSAFEQQKFADDRAVANLPRIDERITLFGKIASYGEKIACERWGPVVKIAVIGTGALGCHFGSNWRPLDTMSGYSTTVNRPSTR